MTGDTVSTAALDMKAFCFVGGDALATTAMLNAKAITNSIPTNRFILFSFCKSESRNCLANVSGTLLLRADVKQENLRQIKTVEQAAQRFIVSRGLSLHMRERVSQR